MSNRCELCDYQATTKGNYVRHFDTLKHKKMEANGGVKNPCPICGKGFSRKSTLDKHMDTHEEGERTVEHNWDCRLCDMTFRDKFNYDIHTGSMTHKKKAIAQVPLEEKVKLGITAFTVNKKILQKVIKEQTGKMEESVLKVIPKKGEKKAKEAPTEVTKELLDEYRAKENDNVIELIDQCHELMRYIKDAEEREYHIVSMRHCDELYEYQDHKQYMIDILNKQMQDEIVENIMKAMK